jgi:hypothetical protein
VFSNRAHPLTTITRYLLCVTWVLLELPGHWSCGLSFSSESPQIITCPARCLDPWLKCVRRPGARMHPLEMTPADGDWQEGHKHKVLRAPEAIAMRFITCRHVCCCQFGTWHGVFQRLLPWCPRTDAVAKCQFGKVDIHHQPHSGYLLVRQARLQVHVDQLTFHIRFVQIFKVPAVQLLTSDKRIIKSKKIRPNPQSFVSCDC